MFKFGRMTTVKIFNIKTIEKRKKEREYYFNYLFN